MSNSFSSHWWYGIALLWVPLAIYIVQLSVVGVFLPPNNDPSLFLAGWLAFVLLWWLSVAIALTFAVCLFMDARAVRKSDLGWRPNQYLYGFAGFFHLAALLVPLAYVVSIPVGLFYLYRRHHHIGTP